MAKMKECLEHYIGARYSLEVLVKEPRELRDEPQHDELKIGSSD